MLRLAFVFCLSLLSVVHADELMFVKNTARELIKRVVPAQAEQFSIEVIAAETGGNDIFEIEDGADGKIILRGNNGVSIASALGHYLKTRAKCHLSFCGDQLSLPEALPKVGSKERIVCPYRHRVFFNWCTLSYTGAWWDWNDWQRVLDFLAMNGINRPLDVTGLECVWHATLMKHGFSDEEARRFLVGPAFFAWQWMTNIQSHGGPLPASWLEQRRELAKRISQRERELGMEPVHQGFSGYVPRELKAKFPDASVATQPSWCSFPGSAQLDPLDPLFAKLAKTWYDELRSLYGPLHYIAADPFHESAPPKPGGEYLGQVGQAIFANMKQAADHPVWVMQSWSIRKEIAMAVPAEDLLVLDLNGERWKGSDKFWGRPFVSGLLHNFGGRINLHGDLRGLARNPFAQTAKAAPNQAGMGLFMEAIVQNPVVYDLALDSVWRSAPVDPETWLAAYARRRYGADSASAVEAWKILLAGPYQPGTMGTENSSMPAARPALDPKKSGPNSGFGIPYENGELLRAWELLMADAPKLSSSDAWRFDVADVGRQVLSNLAQPLQHDLAAAYRAGDRERFAKRVKEFDQLLADLDRLLGTRREYSLGTWIANARRFGTTEAERDLYERNAVLLLTWWGPEKGAPNGDPSIFDYAWREWSGLVGGYYRMRWSSFHQHLADLLERREGWSEERLPQAYGRPALRANPFFSGLADREWQWITQRHHFSSEPVGDVVVIGQELSSKYRPLLESLDLLEVSAALKKSGVPDGAITIGSWKSGQFTPEWRKMTLEVTKNLDSGGPWTFGAVFTGGAKRLHVRNVSLRFGNVVVAGDPHEGRTGNEHVGNTWKLAVPEIPLNTPIILEAEVRTDGGADSNGVFHLRKGE